MTKNIVIKSNEDIVLPILWLGEESHLSYNIRLAGNGAKITLLALLLGKKEDKLNLKIKIYHQKPGTNSKIIIKGALKNSADIKLNGLVKIEPGAKDTNTLLASHILLLSNKAKIQIIPSLEISEKDIKAGHAATIDRINDMELFYIMSRGISEKTAKSLIIQGFLSSILNEFPADIASQTRKKIKNYTSEE
ncbi:SufD family Fe-S cluster assembly protein [Patescibacteria group bacterium]|nr:SufD family Fe-S cluster assembly protein [Patescibacteria group bacterium]